MTKRFTQQDRQGNWFVITATGNCIGEHINRLAELEDFMELHSQENLYTSKKLCQYCPLSPQLFCQCQGCREAYQRYLNEEVTGH